MSKLNFCEQCCRLVPDSEVKNLFGLQRHYYTKTVNGYKNQMPGMIGYYPVKEEVYCGKVREPTDMEYFIFETCKSND